MWALVECYLMILHKLKCYCEPLSGSTTVLSLVPGIFVITEGSI